MQFYIHSRESAVDFAIKYKDKSFAIISITDPDQGLNDFTEACIPEDKILRLQFHDINKVVGDWKLFNILDAQLILGFTERYIGIVDFFIVHCEAGISRSAGTAAALSKIYNGTDEYIFSCGKYIPNMWVYQTILNKKFN